MFKKTFWILVVSLLFLGPVFTQELIPDFSPESVAVLNDELRRTRRTVSGISGEATRVLMWFIAGDLETGTNSSAYLIMPFPGTLVKATAYIKTAPTGADFIIDINKSGTTLWASGKLTVAATANTGSKTTFDSTSVAVDSYFTIDIDQIGSGTAGADLTVLLYVKETLESRL